MALGHIKLDGRWYMLTDLGLYAEGTANQMAHAVGQGQTEYKDLTSWSAWVQEDWQAGGFLYAGGRQPAGAGGGRRLALAVVGQPGRGRAVGL